MRKGHIFRIGDDYVVLLAYDESSNIRQFMSLKKGTTFHINVPFYGIAIGYVEPGIGVLKRLKEWVYNNCRRENSNSMNEKNYEERKELKIIDGVGRFSYRGKLFAITTMKFVMGAQYFPKTEKYPEGVTVLKDMNGNALVYLPENWLNIILEVINENK